MTGCVTSEKNQNLTLSDKLLLQWYFKIGRTGFYIVRWIGRKGWMGKLGEKTVSNNVNITNCAACQYGKQERNPKLEQVKVRIKG